MFSISSHSSFEIYSPIFCAQKDFGPPQRTLDIAVQTGRSGDVWIQLSPSLQSKVQDAFKQNCASPDAQNCEQAIVGALNEGSTIEARQDPVSVAGAAIVAVAAIIIGQDVAKNAEVPAQYHLPPSVVSAITVEQTATATDIAFFDGSLTSVITPTPGPTAPTGYALPRRLNHSAPASATMLAMRNVI